jgi:putative glutamine amidotransferase
MRTIGLTQRVTVVPEYGERRDALDQRWSDFLSACGYLPVPLPNRPHTAVALAQAAGVGGILLTGGNDPVVLGGDAP